MWCLTLLLAILTASPQAAVAQTSESLIKQAQQNAPNSEEVPQSQTLGITDLAGYNAFRLEEEKSRRYSIVGLLVASILSQVLVLIFLVRSNHCTASAIVHGCGLVLVVYATVMVVILARADQQLTAAIGILGAIAGYLFGSAAREQRPQITRQPQPPAG